MPWSLRQVFGPVYSPILIPAVRIVWILIAAYVILRVTDSGLRRLRLLIPSNDLLGVARVEQRTETLRLVIRSVSKVVLLLLVVLMISAELGFNIGPVWPARASWDWRSALVHRALLKTSFRGSSSFLKISLGLVTL